MLERFSAVGGKLNGHYTNRLVHNLNIRFDGVQSKSIINTVSKKLAISAGSACTSDLVEPSHVLLAIGLSENQAHNCIRIGCNRYNTDDEIQVAINEILNALESLAKIRI
jgi:cysteine desulfurase